MRISDWSSDVCSSYLRRSAPLVEIVVVILVEPLLHQAGDRHERAGDAGGEPLVLVEADMVGEDLRRADVRRRGGGGPASRAGEGGAGAALDRASGDLGRWQRRLVLSGDRGAGRGT